MKNQLDQLSAAQSTCLRLVAQNLSSKEIARVTGLTPQTVDQYVRRASVTLGVSNRREAARLLAELEQEAFNKSEFKPETIVPEENPGSMADTDRPAEAGRQPTRLPRGLPQIGGQRHDLGPSKTIYAILRVSFFTTVTVGTLIAIFFWLNAIISR